MAAAIYLGTCERGYRSVVAVADILIVARFGSTPVLSHIPVNRDVLCASAVNADHAARYFLPCFIGTFLTELEETVLDGMGIGFR